MYLVVICALLAVAVIAWLILSSEGKSPESRRNNARIPLVVPVVVETFGEKYQANSQDVSRGGMLLQSEAPVKVAQPVQLAFALPETSLIEIPAVVCHKRGQLFGVRFDPTHQRRAIIERWVRHAFEEDHRRAAKSIAQRQ